MTTKPQTIWNKSNNRKLSLSHLTATKTLLKHIYTVYHYTQDLCSLSLLPVILINRVLMVGHCSFTVLNLLSQSKMILLSFLKIMLQLLMLCMVISKVSTR